MPQKYLLILDIDETLLHTTWEQLKQKPDFCYKGRNVYLRPHLNDFMNFCFANFSVAIYSSAKAEYVKYVLKRVAGDLSKFKFIKTRTHCRKIYKNDGWGDIEIYLKNISLLPGYIPNKTFIIDDRPSTVHPLDSVISVDEFRGNKSDDELLLLQEKLLKLISKNLEAKA
ncbi:HAD family hydrolase [Marinilabiliaceae bacterium ANBcel2]|nr:HAD family hydrolase [Marinilabiliaceae bacterium ANBcel2]